jgi:crotonobetainyl-CoA:carnitine CoA-transferase CaiB-like acyl-CoA transferase
VFQGIRVVELATVVAAPAACALLADFGAEVHSHFNRASWAFLRFSQVIKIEAPGGDMFRKEGAGLQKGRGHGSMFDNANRGKKSVVLDLKQALL